MAGDEDKMEVEPVAADDAAAAKKPAAKAAKGPKKALPAPRFEIKKWNVSFTSWIYWLIVVSS